MSLTEQSASAEKPYDHLVVGAGPSGLAYAWRRHREGRRVRVLDARPPRTRAAPAVVVGAAPYLESLLEALPGAPALEALPSGPLQRLTRGGLRPRRPSLKQRLEDGPGVLPLQVRRRLAGMRRPDTTLRVLRGGEGALLEALGSALGSALQTQATVSRVQPGHPGRDRARAWTEAGPLDAHEVALDPRAEIQASLLAEDAPLAADVLRSVRYEAVVEVRLSIAPDRLPDIAGFVSDADSPSRMRRAVFITRPETPDVLVLARLEGDGLDAIEASTLGRISVAELDRAVGRRTSGVVRDVRIARRCRPAPGHRGRMAALECDLEGRGIRLLGSAALGETLDRLVSPGVGVAGPLPEGTTVA